MYNDIYQKIESLKESIKVCEAEKVNHKIIEKLQSRLDKLEDERKKR